MKKTLLISAVSAALCVTVVSAQTQKRAVAPAAMAATTTIYKLVDDSGRITYSNLPLKGATVVDLEPLTVITTSTRASTATAAPQSSGHANININTAEGSNSLPATAALASTSAIAAAVVTTAIPATVALAPPSSLPNVDTGTQKRRDDMRRKILEDEMRAEEKQLADAVIALNAHESDRTVINLMRSAAEKGTPAAYVEARRNYDLREEKLKSFQESISNHEKNVGALKKELAALR